VRIVWRQAPRIMGTDNRLAGFRFEPIHRQRDLPTDPTVGGQGHGSRDGGLADKADRGEVRA
jgi:hypothetical protein